jgi:hypothetical protein
MRVNSNVKDIPADYDGVMGVPITFLEKHNPDQFDIVGIAKTWFGAAVKTYPKQVQVDKSGMADDDVSKKKGIYHYVLTRKEKHLSIRAFTDNQKREAYERQKGICTVCKEHFDISEMEADHVTPWHAGGKTAADNCQMLCKEDNRRKSGI